MSTEQTAESAESTDMDKVISRIQKILSRANTASGTTEAEADTALKMAQELAMKHNLDLAAIEATGAANGNPNAPAERVKDELKGRAMYKWQRQLAKYVAESNFCYHLIQERSEWVPAQYELDAEWLVNGKPNEEAKHLQKRVDSDTYHAMKWEDKNMYHRETDGRYKKTHKHIFVGRKGNVITAQLMFQYLTQTIEDLVVVEMNLTNAQRLSRSAMSWKEGASDRLCERLSERRQDLIAKHDAKAKQEEEDRKADAQRAHAERVAKTPKGLPAHHESEVKAAFEGMDAGAYDATGTNEAEDPERPDIDDEEPWTPEGDEVVEPETGTALVLASVYDESEREANWELAHGYEPGYLAKRRAEREERERLEAEEAAKEEAEEVMDKVEAPVKQETERQRTARINRENREWAASRRRWAREDAAAARREAREYAKRDHSAYRKGAEKGKSIGLDIQIKAGKEAKKLS